MKMTVFWDVTPCSLAQTDRRLRLLTAHITLMMKAASTSGTSVNFYQTTRLNIPEDSHLHIRRRENLKSHQPTEELPMRRAGSKEEKLYLHLN
jgi:hypothetical protein